MQIITDIQQILRQAQQNAYHSINRAMQKHIGLWANEYILEFLNLKEHYPYSENDFRETVILNV